MTHDLPIKGGVDKDAMNLQMCNSMCQADVLNSTFLCFGVQAGTHCWCGNSPGSYDTGNCTNTCVGSPDVACGAQSSISVYQIARLAV